MRKSFLLGLAVLGLGIWIGLCFLIIGEAVPAEYQITRFPFGPHTYELAEPTIDWTGFRGRITDVMEAETFSLHVFEGSDNTGNNWIVMSFLVEHRGEKREPVVLSISIHENVKSKSIEEMKSTSLYHRGYIETGMVDYKLVSMDPPPDFKKYIDNRIRGGKKIAI